MYGTGYAPGSKSPGASKRLKEVRFSKEGFDASSLERMGPGGDDLRGKAHSPAGGARRADQRLLILQAAQAAPKPLSMFTTVTPLAQEVSMPRRADRPEKAAP